MDLPPALRQAVDEAIAGLSGARIAEAANRLSQRYRGEVRDGSLHVSADDDAAAYLATRLPATYAAIRAALSEVAIRMPDFSPQSLLDLGAGPGTALFAARDLWPSISSADLVEASATMRRWGTRLAETAPDCRTLWHEQDVTRQLPPSGPHDVVTLAYVLDELDPASRQPLVEAAWRAAASLVVIVEPGTPSGWRRIADARATMIELGANVVAPCPHEAACPILEPDWCHFSRRLARSRIHRLGKEASVPFEDEKFAYCAFARFAPVLPSARVLSQPRTGSGKVLLKLCLEDGHVAERLLTRRDGEIFRAARRLGWGDAVEA